MKHSLKAPPRTPPIPELTTQAFSEAIAGLITTNSNVASLTAGYSKAVDTHQRAFRKDADAVYRLLSPIDAAYGKESQKGGQYRIDDPGNAWHPVEKSSPNG